MNKGKVILTAFLLISCMFAFSCADKRYRMVSEAMEPTINEGDTYSADLSIYKTQLPQRWDIVLFNSPPEPEYNWAMRVVGLPGEVIDFDSLGITINGDILSVPIPGIKYSKGVGRDTLSHPYTIPDNHYYVIGDNVSNSYDSRFWGALPFSKIFGKAILD
jgi:signal peptidase I